MAKTEKPLPSMGDKDETDKRPAKKKVQFDKSAKKEPTENDFHIPVVTGTAYANRKMQQQLAVSELRNTNSSAPLLPTLTSPKQEQTKRKLHSAYALFMHLGGSQTEELFKRFTATNANRRLKKKKTMTEEQYVQKSIAVSMRRSASQNEAPVISHLKAQFQKLKALPQLKGRSKPISEEDFVAKEFLRRKLRAAYTLFMPLPPGSLNNLTAGFQAKNAELHSNGIKPISEEEYVVRSIAERMRSPNPDNEGSEISKLTRQFQKLNNERDSSRKIPATEEAFIRYLMNKRVEKLKNAREQLSSEKIALTENISRSGASTDKPKSRSR